MSFTHVRVIRVFTVCLVFSALSASGVFGQRQVDSLRNVLKRSQGKESLDIINQLASYIKDADPYEADSLATSVLITADDIDYPEAKVKAWLLLATIASRQSDFLKTDSLISLSMALATDISDHFGQTSALLARGVLNIRRGKYDEAIQNHIDGLKAAKAIGDGDLMQTHTMNIGHIKSRLNLPEEADEFFLESLEIAKEYYLTLRIGQVYLALGVSAYQREDLEDCIVNYEKALPVFLELEEHRSAGIVLNNLGYAFYLKKDFIKANQYYDRSLKFRTELNDQLGVSRIWLNKARIKFEQGEYREARRLNNHALEIARKVKSPRREMEVLEFMVKIHEKGGNLQDALITLKKHNQLKDSVNTMANRQRVAELSAEFDLERKENELQLARQELTLLEQKESLLTARQFLMAAVILVLILFIAVIWIYQKGRVKRALINERLAEQKAENEALLKQRLSRELELKDQELKSIADRLAQQNQRVQDFKAELSEQSTRRENLIESEKIESIINFLERQPESYLTWQHFRLKFDENYPDFTARLVAEYPDLTTNEIDISILLKINLPNKEMAQILNISYDAIKKSLQRMYRKMGLSTPEELRVHILKA